MTDRWILNVTHSSQATIDLFCFPYAGGGASIFRSWNKLLPRNVQVHPIQLPGRENRIHELPFSRLDWLVETLGPILAEYCGGPFALFGHSLGALVCFEVARLLRREFNLSPNHLFISACAAPQVSTARRMLHQLTDDELINVLRDYGGTAETILRDPEFLQIILPLLRADFTVFETYQYTYDEPFICPITVFRGTSDNLVNDGDVQLWHDHTTSQFSVHVVPGQHFFIHESYELLLQLILSDLRQYVTEIPK